MFNIANFSAHIKDRGTLQTNKFIVRFGPPEILKNGYDVVQRSIEYRANSVKIPGVNLDLQQVQRYGVGPQQKFPTNVNFSDIDINFVDMNGNVLWKYFVKWLNGIFDYTGTTGRGEPSYKVEYKKNYITDIIIYVYNNDGVQTNAIVLKEAFPISLSDVSLSWSDNNRLYEFNTRFTFKEWYYGDYVEGIFQSSGSANGPTQSFRVTPTPTESPRPQNYSSSTESSTGNGPLPPQVLNDLAIARGGVNTPPGGAGQTFQPGQSVIGNEQVVPFAPLAGIRRFFGF